MAVKDKCNDAHSIELSRHTLDQLRSKEWLLTNSRGSFASSTFAGNTRRYHSLLTASTTPPANRVLALSNVVETISSGDENITLTNIEFARAFTGDGHRFLKSFTKDVGVHFEYNIKLAKLTKSIYLLPEIDAVAIRYKFREVVKPLEFAICPLVGLRDFHSLNSSPQDCEIFSSWQDEGLVVSSDKIHGKELLLRSEDMWFESGEDWWYDFHYCLDAKRGQDSCEALWTPGVFKREIDFDCEIVFWASVGDVCNRKELSTLDLDISVTDLKLRQKEMLKNSQASGDKILGLLNIAAEEFIIEREIDNKKRKSILAGYPWFLDWGRDTFISLPGLLLERGKFEDAYSVLETFAQAVSEGMIPNRFDDFGGKPHYNSIDASLWFIDAGFKYHHLTRDTKRFKANILPCILEIIDSYKNGTRFGIHCDSDGLLMGGSQKTQLTWMDAKCDGVTFTPRYGKAVEINALWYNGLCCCNEFYSSYDTNINAHKKFKDMADLVEESFLSNFWDEGIGYLADCIFPDGRKDFSIRPNQIFAVSLPFSPLPTHIQLEIVNVVKNELLTPYGLRSLAQSDKNYRTSYSGSQFQRDSAYHQGTVWAYLIGPFIEALLRSNNFSTQSKVCAKEIIAPLLKHFLEDGCITSVSEIFDADEPHKPRGCFAQAWSVAALLQAYKLTR